jgi:hypothetical protein
MLGMEGVKARVGIGLLVTAAFSVQCHQASRRTEAVEAGAPPQVALMCALSGSESGLTEIEQMARTRPLQFLQHCWDNYRRTVRDFECTFTKQEMIHGQLLPEQVARVRFLQEPFSVDMTFTKNVRQCKRALYVEGKWRDAEGRELALVEPGGSIIRVLISKIKQPIHGARAEQESRRTIDQFGFDKSFELIMKYSLRAEDEGALRMQFMGHGSIDGRPTYVLQRHLPYTGDELPYPDSLLIIHIDQETLLPTACYSYADAHGNKLLGSYVYTDIRLNRNYTVDDFDPAKIDF